MNTVPRKLVCTAHEAAAPITSARTDAIAMLFQLVLTAAPYWQTTLIEPSEFTVICCVGAVESAMNTVPR